MGSSAKTLPSLHSVARYSLMTSGLSSADGMLREGPSARVLVGVTYPKAKPDAIDNVSLKTWVGLLF